MHNRLTITDGFSYRELHALGNILKYIGKHSWSDDEVGELTISYNNHTDLIALDNGIYCEYFDVKKWSK